MVLVLRSYVSCVTIVTLEKNSQNKSEFSNTANFIKMIAKNSVHATNGGVSKETFTNYVCTKGEGVTWVQNWCKIFRFKT